MDRLWVLLFVSRFIHRLRLGVWCQQVVTYRRSLSGILLARPSTGSAFDWLNRVSRNVEASVVLSRTIEAQWRPSWLDPWYGHSELRRYIEAFRAAYPRVSFAESSEDSDYI